MHLPLLLVVLLSALPSPPARNVRTPAVIVVHKQELRLEIWRGGTRMRQFGICSLSSLAGRKRAQGDQLVPEGIYAITGYNAKSASYKTLRVNYPNAFDRTQNATGGGIGIHGNCASSGCVGMRNGDMDSIVKTLARELKHLPIPLLIFPSEKDLRVRNLIRLHRDRGEENEAVFLERLETIRIFWNQHHHVPRYSWDSKGYRLEE